jgi:MFS transporter, FLVCR family, feline leukemia virus subgroup C receptor-related protein
MDLTHSQKQDVAVVGDAYMPGSKSTDLIKTNGSEATLETKQHQGKSLCRSEYK